MGKTRQPKIQCPKCYSWLELPDWKYYHTKQSLTGICECQWCEWCKTIVLPKEERKENEKHQ